MVANIIAGGCLSYLWGMLNAMSSLTILYLVSVNIPGLAGRYSKIILSFAQLDLLPTDLIFDNIFTFANDNDEALNPYFDRLGLSSSYSIKNMGSTFVFFVGHLSFYPVILVAYLLNFKRLFEFLKPIVL